MTTSPAAGICSLDAVREPVWILFMWHRQLKGISIDTANKELWNKCGNRHLMYFNFFISLCYQWTNDDGMITAFVHHQSLKIKEAPASFAKLYPNSQCPIKLTITEKYE